MPLSHFSIPADVPRNMRNTYIHNYNHITQQSGRLFLFACDQKIEHLNDDFAANNAHSDASTPEHMFRIAQQGRIGAMATHLGLIARYGGQYTTIPYVIKLNAKTNLIPETQQDPLSALLTDVRDVITFKNESGLHIAGVGLTLYLGSIHEPIMLKQAANAIFAAHQQGLIALLWVYPRGEHINDDADPHLAAGAIGVADALGADFVKIKVPRTPTGCSQGSMLKRIVPAAGNTRVICSGGPKKDSADFLYELYEQLQEGNTGGCATGRNIFQRSLPEAVALTRAISSLVFDGATVEHALVFMQKLS